ncbi:MAG TPA: MFS transporter [Stellaceae bacterium]|jgi:predicted MFS family arabinose efflux permease|nr:MFS transporter [Stellaceae bacterium]
MAQSALEPSAEAPMPTASPDMQAEQPSRAFAVSVIGAASLLMLLGMGMRQSFGLFMVPITGDLGLSVSDFTFALAVQNMIWGVTQPFVGAIADRFGMRMMLVTGSLFFSAGLAVTLAATGPMTLFLGLGVLIGISLSCTASNLSLAATARVVSEARRSTTLGIVAGIGSFGTFLVAPTAQKLIALEGWHFAIGAFVILSALMLPAALVTGRVDRVSARRHTGGGASPDSFRSVLRAAAHHRGYVTMATAIFVCGLQLIFLSTHLPSYLAICGADPMLAAQALATIAFFNVIGCYLLGWLGGKFPKHILLGLVYVLRSLCIAAYFVMPPTPATTLIFAGAMGLMWLGVIPLTQGLIIQMFGLRFLATLSGIMFFTHQVGSFLGAWGGGLIYDHFGSYDHAWQLGVAIGLVAGVAQMMTDDQPGRPILREASA